MTPIRILELRSVRGTGGGPEKTILLGAARSDPARFAVTVCYIRDARDEVFSIDKRAAAMGVDYEEVVERHSFDPSVLGAIGSLIRRRRIDIVHAHDYKTDVLTWLLRSREGIVPLSTAHGWAGHSPRETWLYHPIDKITLRAFPRVIAVSEDIRLELIRYGCKPAEVLTILNGIEPAAFRRERAREPEIRQRLGLATGDVVIASVGRLETEKRYDVLIDAVAELRTRRPEIKLLIVGEGSLRTELEQRAARANLGDACRLLGLRADVADLHHAFAAFVQSSSNEGAPNAVLEAMALETPVVATAVGGTAQLVRDGVDGLLVPSGDASAIVRALERTLGDPIATAGRVATARRRVETDLSFDTRMARVEAVYTDLYNRFRAPATTMAAASA